MHRSNAESASPIVDEATEGDVAASIVHVHVQPRSGRTEIIGRHGDALKIRVAAPPVDGRATEAAAAALAEALEVPRRTVTLRGGATSRHKRFLVVGLGRSDVERSLSRYLD